MSRPRCVCGCKQPAANRHHVIYQQELRRVANERERGKKERRDLEARLVADKRNMVWMAFGCHQAHHGQHWRLPLEKLPDGVFEFAVEVLGAGRAYEYLRRRYSGQDARLDALLEQAA